MFWLLLLTGLGGGILLGFGQFGPAAVLAAWAVWECSRVPDPKNGNSQRSLAMCLFEVFLLAGLVFYYRESVKLECLALFALLGAFVEAHFSATTGSLPPRRVIARLRVMALCAWFTTVTAWFWEGSDPVLGHPIAYPLVSCLAITCAITHFASVGMMSQLMGTMRRRQRAWQRLCLVKNPPRWATG
jgi:hypothetical protein